MKLNTASVIAAFTLLAGWYFHQPYLWVPATILLAAVVDLFTRRLVMSDDRATALDFPPILWGSAPYLKAIFGIVGLYAMVGQVICATLLAWWAFT